MMEPVTHPQWTQTYEALRGQALGSIGLGCHSHGLSLFLTRGMSAWLAALKVLERPKPVRREALVSANSGGRALALSLRSDFTLIVAEMVEACQ